MRGKRHESENMRVMVRTILSAPEDVPHDLMQIFSVQSTLMTLCGVNHKRDHSISLCAEGVQHDLPSVSLPQCVLTHARASTSTHMQVDACKQTKKHTHEGEKARTHEYRMHIHILHASWDGIMYLCPCATLLKERT